MAEELCKSLEAAFLPVIDGLPAFVLLISMVRSPPILLLPSSLSPPVPFLSYCPPPSGPLFLHPPILPPSHHSLTLMPSSPSLKALDPVTPSPHVSSFKYIFCMGSYQNFNTFLEAQTGYCCIHI